MVLKVVASVDVIGAEREKVEGLVDFIGAEREKVEGLVDFIGTEREKVEGLVVFGREVRRASPLRLFSCRFPVSSSIVRHTRRLCRIRSIRSASPLCTLDDDASCPHS